METTKETFNLIPKSFELGGTTINVVFKKLINQGYHLGRTGKAYAKVELATLVIDDSEPIPAAADSLTSTFYHELVHNILYCMGRNETEADKQIFGEDFTEAFSHLLHQFMKSFKPLDDDDIKAIQEQRQTTET
jgi:hypothetical protein